jgi:hypothetical protein
MATFLFFPRLLYDLKWGLLFDERRGLTSTDHSTSTGGWLEGTLNNWLSPLRLPQTLRTRSLHLCLPVTGWPSYTPGHWVPFSPPSTTRRATVEAIEPASTRGNICITCLKIKKSTFCQEGLFLDYVWLSKQKAIIFLYCNNRLVFAIEMQVIVRYELNL